MIRGGRVGIGLKATKDAAGHGGSGEAFTHNRKAAIGNRVAALTVLRGERVE